MSDGGLLAGLRVVEAAHPLTEYAGLLLAGLGAEVYLVEPPGGCVMRQRLPRVPGAGNSPRGSMAFLTRNTGKRSVVLDSDDPSQRALLENLCARADVVLNAEGAPHHDVIAAAAARVRVTVTDPRALGSSSIVAFAASGGMASSGWPHQPPCNSPSWLALDGAGVYAAVMALVGVLAQRRGSPSLDYRIPLHEGALAAITPWTRTLHAYGMEVAGQGIETRRVGPGGFPIYPASDGYVRVLTATPKQWDAFVKLMGSPEDLVSGPWADPLFRAENADALQPMCADITRKHTARWLFLEGQRLGLTVTPVYTLNGFREDPHVRGRNILVTLDDPEFGAMEMVRPPLVVDEGAGDAPILPAPGPNEHFRQAESLAAEPLPAAQPNHGGVDVRRPLAGLRVLELGVGAVVPEAASLLAQLGAEVIKLESLKRVDFLRQNGLNGYMDVNNSPTFNQLNLGASSLAADMTQPDGARLVQELARRCDVIMENMRGGVVEQWGLDAAAARRLRADVIYLSSQGLGRGEYDGFQTYGPNLQTFSGITWMWGHPDDPFPVGTTLSHPDHIAGKQALVPLLAALLRRDASGRGATLDATQVEAAAYLIADRYLEQYYRDGDLMPQGNRAADMAPHGCYPCAGEDRWVAIAVENDRQWQRLCEALGSTAAAWVADPALSTRDGRLGRRDELDEVLGQWTRSRTADEIECLLRRAGVPVSRVVTGDDIVADQESHASGFFATLAHPTAGTRVYTALPVQLAGHGRPPARRPPLLGEHTEHVLYDVLSMGGDLVDALMAGKTVGH